MKKSYVAKLYRALLPCVALLVVASARAEDPGMVFTWENYSFYVDGVSLAERVGTMGGRVFWFSLPRQGQFIISPDLHDHYKFEKIAKLRGNTISFSYEGKFYQVVSEGLILKDGGEMDLYVARDAEFQPKGCGEQFCAGSNANVEYFLKHRKREENR